MEAYLVRPAKPTQQHFAVPLDMLTKVFGNVVFEFFKTRRTKLRWDIVLWLPADPRPYFAEWRSKGINFRGSVLFLDPSVCRDFKPVVRVGNAMAIRAPPCNMDSVIHEEYRSGFARRAGNAIEAVLSSELGHVTTIPNLLLRVPFDGEVAVQVTVNKVVVPRSVGGGEGGGRRRRKVRVPFGEKKLFYVPVFRVVSVRDDDAELFVRTFAPFLKVVATGSLVKTRFIERKVGKGKVGIPEEALEQFLRLVVTEDLEMVWSAEIRSPPPGRSYIVHMRKLEWIIYGLPKQVLSISGIKECLLKERGRRGRR